jgi:cell division protein FtsW
MTAAVRAHKPDYFLLAITGMLVIAGIFIIASASPVSGASRYGEAYFYLKNQLFGVGIGSIALLAGWRIPYGYWKKFAPFALIGSLILMTLVFIPGIGLELKGATRWIELGPITIQPAEITKLAFIVYLAAWLSTKQKEIRSFSAGFLPFLVMLGVISMFFILQPDIGTLGVLAITATLLFFSGGGRFLQIGVLLLIGAASFILLVTMQPYRLDRIMVFLEPATDTQGIGYQLNQSLIAIGSGGIWGKGFGMSRQKLNFLPEPTGDSIFAVYSEEFGFAGSMLLITLFLLFAWRGMRIARRAPDPFTMHLATGITLLIIVQAFINMAAISGLLPLTGLPLSFISYGSSALVVNMAQIGILMNISKHTQI